MNHQQEYLIFPKKKKIKVNSKKVLKSNIIDLFAGIGGFHIGASSSYLKIGRKINPLIVSELENSCQEIYRENFNCEVLGDINNIPINDYKNHEVDLITAGFPCQPFSNSGRKLGLDDPRGKFYYKIEEFIKHFEPKSFILENVPGIKKNGGGNYNSLLSLSPQKIGNTMKFLEDNLVKLSNYSIKWIELNSADFGSPQVRKRVYIIGLHKDYNKLVLNFPFFKENNFISIVDRIKQPELELNNNQKDNILSFMSKPPSYNNGMRRVGQAYLCKGGNVGQAYHAYGKVPTLTKVWAKFLPIYFPHNSENLPNIGEKQFMPNKFYGKGYVRKASIKELAALQGFPKSYIPHKKRTIASEHFGNSVNTKVVEAIADLLTESLY
jgi:DNA (cytosine-5)-methyltransferase 1